jgi:hypothetical protein
MKMSRRLNVSSPDARCSGELALGFAEHDDALMRGVLHVQAGDAAK